jgi:hypothetical protein
MARECLKEAAATRDASRKKSLEEIAKLYIETALNLEGVMSEPTIMGRQRRERLNG